MSQANPDVSSERELKQDYLKVQIIDKGFDPDKFSEFVCALKTDGASVDVWTTDELKEVVQKFIDSETAGSKNEVMPVEDSGLFSSKVLRKSTASMRASEETKPKGKELLQEPQPKVEEKEETKEQLSNQEQKIVKEDTRASLVIERPSATDPIQGTIQVMKMEPTILGQEKDVSVKVGDPVHIKRGIFTAGYSQYMVKTEPLGWAVKRRFNDFFWLRNTLQKIHPGIFIPPIPKKKNKNKFHEDVIRKRTYLFEIFLNTCLQNEDLKNDKNLYYFLYEADESTFRSKQRAGNQLPRVERLENLATASGEATLNMSSEYIHYTSLAEEYCKQTEPMYKNIRKLTKLLITNIKHSANIVTEMGSWFKDLQEVSREFNSKLLVQQSQSLKFEDTYTALSKMVVDWSEQLQKQATIIHKNFLCFYEYSALENNVFSEINTNKAKFEAECARVTKELNAKKEKLYNKADITQWEMDQDKARLIPRSQLIDDKILAFEVMLAEETKRVRYQNNMLAYLNAANYAEIIRGLDTRASLYKKNFKEFVIKQTEYMTELQAKWVQLAGCSDEETLKLLNKSILIAPKVEPKKICL